MRYMVCGRCWGWGWLNGWSPADYSGTASWPHTVVCPECSGYGYVDIDRVAIDAMRGVNLEPLAGNAADRNGGFSRSGG